MTEGPFRPQSAAAQGTPSAPPDPGPEQTGQEPFVTMYHQDISTVLDAVEGVTQAASPAGSGQVDDSGSQSQVPDPADSVSASDPAFDPASATGADADPGADSSASSSDSTSIATGTDFSNLAELLSHSGVDTIWLDLDGDQVPETAVPIDGPFTSAEAGYDQADYDTPDGWVSVPLDGQDGAAYDISALIPDGPAGPDWTAPGVQGYDPMALHNFSVEQGPLVFDPSGGQAWSPADYTSTDLWFNNGSYDHSAGYWDTSYVAMPGQPDPAAWSAQGSQWNSTPVQGNPMEFTQASAGYDPGWPGATPFDPNNPLPTYSNPYVNFDPNNPLPTYSNPYVNFDPNHPLPTYTPYNGDPSTLPAAQMMQEQGIDPSTNPAYQAMQQQYQQPGMPFAPGTSQMPGTESMQSPYAMPGADSYSVDSYSAGPSADPYAMQSATPYTTPAGSDTYSSYDPSAGNPTDVVTNYYTDPTFDDQLSQASSDSGFWMDQYHDASDLSWQYWNASVDASTAGDDLLAYDLNQLSLNAGDVANTAWSNSNSAWDSVSSTGSAGSSFDTSGTTSSADDGWYNAMSLDS